MATSTPTASPAANTRRTSAAVNNASASGSASASTPAPSQGSHSGSVSIADCESFAAKLMDPSGDVKTKLQIATELRESVDQFRDIDYARYLDHLLPAFKEVLRNGKPVFVKDSLEQKLRHTLLEIIQRLPHNDNFRPWANSIMELMIHLLRVENEDNGVVCIKIVIDQNRTFKDEVESHVQPFLELVKEMYGNLRGVVEEEFGREADDEKPAIIQKTVDKEDKTLRPSLKSFKVLTECPIAIVLVFQTWRTMVFPYIREYFPLVMECLNLQAEPQRKAHAAALEKGEIFVGVAQEIHNRELYQEFIVAQVKTMSFLAYVLRTASDDIRKHAEAIAEASIRLLMDCPPESVPSRKELLVATRHILSTDFRTTFVSQIDAMLHEPVLVGTGITSQETLRPLAYSMLADLVHHVKSDLSVHQLSRIVHIYSCCLQEPSFAMGVQVMCGKLLLNLIDTLTAKVEKSEVPKYLTSILETSVDKLCAIEAIHTRMAEIYAPTSVLPPSETVVEVKPEDQGNDSEKKGEKEKQKEKEVPAWLLIERAKPVHAVAYASEGVPEGFSRDLYLLPDTKFLIKTLLHGVRSLLSQLRVFGAPPPNGGLLGRLFEAQTRLLGYYNPLADQREEKESLDHFIQILLLFDPHVFAEVWTLKMDFFVEQALSNPHLLSIPQTLLVPPHSNTHLCDTSHQLVAMLLKYLMSKLETFGTQDKKRAALTLKLFKLAFMAVNQFPEQNEMVLVPQLAKLITSSFTYAARSPEPTIYFSILRALFRSIGGGRFEALYKEVLPILQEMLDTLNYLLLHAEPEKRDLFVELCLTVPVRLTNLLPHLGYLMKPLVHALRAGPELVSQGLRTLELCIDNLTSEFLDPTLGPVRRDLMAALHDLLKPIPFNHNHSHATVKILGKLGGRNRRSQQVTHLLEYHVPAPEASAAVFFDGHKDRLPFGTLTPLAVDTMRHPDAFYRGHAADFLKMSSVVFVGEGIANHEQEAVFQQTIKGLFLATLPEELKETMIAFIKDLSRSIFASEYRRQLQPATSTTPAVARPDHRGALASLTRSYLSAIALALADMPEAESATGQVLVSLVIEQVMTVKVEDGPADFTPDPINILDCLARRFSSLCYEESWRRKLAGCAGISVLSTKEDIPQQWIVERQIEFIRPLLFILKDMPNDPPRTVSTVVDTIKYIVKKCNSDTEIGISQRSKLLYNLIRELACPNAVVRETVQDCIELLSTLTGISIPELLDPGKASLLNPIFDKPLRALPFSMQIGNIEAITYSLNLRPSLPDINDELVRLLHEAIALADADDVALIGRSAQHRNELNLKNLRVSCLKLLAAAMECPEFFAKHTNVRSRVIAVYFKHVYSTTNEIMEVAHHGLRHVLKHQNKLPKEVLQSGLRPILVNLADAKRLSVSGLEGLARFLELLTNYFKVEIGHKLLDHFKTLADEPNMLHQAALAPLEDSADIARMVRLVNVFRLLPSTANMFLTNLTNLVVDAESSLHQSSPGPFTQNLTLYLNRYAKDALAFLFDNLKRPEVIRTFRNVIQSGEAVDLIAELSSEVESIKLGSVCFGDVEAPDLVTPGLLIVTELVKKQPRWLLDHTAVLESIISLWRTDPSRMAAAMDPYAPSDLQKEPMLIVQLFISVIKVEDQVPLIFDIIHIYTLDTDADLAPVTDFLYQHLAVNSSTDLKRSVLQHFLGVFADNAVSWSFKMHALRLLVNPILLVFFTQNGSGNDLIDAEFLTQTHSLIWLPMMSENELVGAGDAVKIELLQMSILLVQYCPNLLSELRKEIIKMAWLHIRAEDPTVKHTSYVLIARFIEKNECPQKIVMQVWSGLLKLSPTDGRVLVRQAIDILAPVLPQRVLPTNASHPPWAQVVRKILVEEGHSTPQLISILELIVGHPDLFYESREIFVPTMVNSLSRLGSSNAATPEMKRLSIDIVDLILTWEMKRAGTVRSSSLKAQDDSATGSKRPSDGDMPSPKRTRLDRAGTVASSSGGTGGWAPSGTLRESMVSFVVRLVALSPEPISAGGLIKRAFELLRELLGPVPWSPVAVKLSYFTRTLVPVEFTDAALPAMNNSAQVLALAALDKPDAWFISQMGLLQKLVEKSCVSNESSLHESLRPVLERMFEVLDLENPEPDTVVFGEWAETTITESLKSSTGIKGALFILRAWSRVKSGAEKIEATFSSLLMRVLNKIAKEHMVATNNPVNGQPQPEAATVDLIIDVLDMCRTRVNILKDQRRWLLSALVQLIEKTTSIKLCRYLIDILRDWVLDPKEVVPTHKEKAGLVLKMMQFEKRNDDQLMSQFLQLVLDIYSQPFLRRTELTTRLEPAFLLGTRSQDPVLRSRFLDMFHENLPSTLVGRLHYILGSQTWESISSQYWIQQALDFLLGAIDLDDRLLTEIIFQMDNTPFHIMMAKARVRDLILPIRRLIHLDVNVAHKLWISVFKTCWSAFNKSQQSDTTKYLIGLLAREQHSTQMDARPNVIQTLLEGVLACSPAVALPPFVVKYLGKTYGAWYTSIELLNTSLTLESVRSDDIVRESTRDGLAELFADLAEDDLFYGLWRRRSIYLETNAALSYEQNGMWPLAQQFYETAQIKARTGVLPFTEPEYCLWEDHWILCSQKLQQWDILTDLARSEVNHDLMLECAWRLSDWGSSDLEAIEATLSQVSDVHTPRRKVFEAYACLIKAQSNPDQNANFSRIMDEAFQLSIRKWVALPKAMTMAHVPLLQLFQQYVELQEASAVFDSLLMTNAQNLEFRVNHDLKGIFTTWRERLPNFWDDISVWSDLLAWRQHVFSAVTKVYVPLIPQGETATYGYRGYHETAWMINRFGHVARKHQLTEVCSHALNKIYALPNIEISEAFLKLREQAMCHYQKPERLSEGLESISTTNLMYFAPAQKAEFLTLKGMFIAKLGQYDDANSAFAHAVQMDLNLPKAWAEWGRFNDKQFKEKPTESSLAANAVSCYLQAAGLYKSKKTRKLLVRVLWLLSLDDPPASPISRAFEAYKGDVPIWYWITLVPQLLLSLSHREARHARHLLMKIAKTYPQALFYQLRTSKEEFNGVRKQFQERQAKQAAQRQAMQAAEEAKAAAIKEAEGVDSSSMEGVQAEGTATASTPASTGTPTATNGTEQPSGNGPAPAAALPAPNVPQPPRQPWELVEEILNILKTAFPLLALSMEKMVDQINSRGKTTLEEDYHRVFNVFILELQDLNRSDKNVNESIMVEASKRLLSFVGEVANFDNSLRPQLEEDFGGGSTRLGDTETIRKLQNWRDRFEDNLNRRSKKQSIDQANCFLAEFHHGKFDEVEIPGQYLQHVDNNTDFAKITRFSPTVEVGRHSTSFFRRITMIGDKGSQHSFMVQCPSPRHARREDRVGQVFRTLSTVLQSRKESRKRNLSFHIPPSIPLALGYRLVELDSSYCSFQDIYESHCKTEGIFREDPILYYSDRYKQLYDPSKTDPTTITNLRMEIMDEIQTKFVPQTVISNYMIRCMKTPSDLFLMRKQFTLQMASATFMTYVAAVQERTPSKYNISRGTGLIWMNDLLPAIPTDSEAPPVLSNNDDPVEFRLTPNIQHFMTPNGIEGLLTAALVAMGRGLCPPEFDLEDQLSLFLKDEVYHIFNVQKRAPRDDLSFRQSVLQNVEAFANRVKVMSCQYEREKFKAEIPVNQAVITLINKATNRQNLARMKETWQSWM